MTQETTFRKIALEALSINTISGIIISIAAWGTRFVSQIPTQDILPAAMVGVVGSTTTTISFEIIKQFDTKLYSYFKQSMSEEAAVLRGNIIIMAFSMVSGLLVSSLATPTIATLAGRNISYSAATAFSLLNFFTYIPQTALLFPFID